MLIKRAIAGQLNHNSCVGRWLEYDFIDFTFSTKGWRASTDPGETGTPSTTPAADEDCSWLDTPDRLPPQDERPIFVQNVRWRGCTPDEDEVNI